VAAGSVRSWKKFNHFLYITENTGPHFSISRAKTVFVRVLAAKRHKSPKRLKKGLVTVDARRKKQDMLPDAPCSTWNMVCIDSGQFPTANSSLRA
jgi:hypothetical protein